MALYRDLLSDVGLGRLNLKNRDYDTGWPTHAGEYRLADDTYSGLLRKLAEHDFAGVTPELRNDVLKFYGDLTGPIATKKHPEQWQKTLAALQRLSH